MRKRGSLFLALLLFFATIVHAEEMPDIQAKGAVLIERSSGRILYAKNANERLPMASTTKVMTALLAIENSSLEDVVTAGKNAFGVPGTSIYLRRGEQLSMRDMLYGLLMRSGNDAAVAIAEHIDGDTDVFAKRMNARALQLDADANFVNPHGLDAKGHSASALGMARIASKALEYGVFREIVSTKKATIPWPGNPYARVLENKNKLLNTLEGATGVKTGFTNGAGRCLVFSCERGGMELVGVVLNCGSWFDSASELTEWGFANYHAEHLFNKGDVAISPWVRGGIDRRVDALYAKSVDLPVLTSETPLVLIEMDPLSAPIEEGQRIGHAIITIDGKTESVVELLARNDVPKGSYGQALRRVFLHWKFG